MAYPRRLRYEGLRTLGFAAIGAAYAAIGTALANPARVIIAKNLTDKSVLFSINGVTDHFIIPSGGFQLIDVTTNKVRDDGFFTDQGTVFYAKQGPSGAPASGSVYIEVIYAA